MSANNVQFPDSKFGPGPLPTSSVLSGGPAGSSGDPDGKINATDSLLGNVQPYSYAKSARMGSDKNFQQIPHRMQHIVHQLYLPYADKKQNELFAVSHAVDQGDIAFVVQTNRIQGLLFNQHMQRDIAVSRTQMPKRNAFVNLPTLNFILAGLQRVDSGDHITSPWKSLAIDLGYQFTLKDHSLETILYLVKNVFIPYGICAGSEHQGGKHETGLAPVQAAVNHVTTMTIDGQNRDLVNYWRRHNIGAGDQLIFRIEYLPTQAYTLNHYYKGTVHQMFPTKEWCWQLVPDKFTMSYDKTRYDNHKRYDSPEVLSYDYRLHGYWRIGQMFQHRGKHDIEVENYSNDLCFLRGQLLQVTFAPMWVEYEKPDTVARKNTASGGKNTFNINTQHKRPRMLGPRGPLGKPNISLQNSSGEGSKRIRFEKPGIPIGSRPSGSGVPRAPAAPAASAPSLLGRAAGLAGAGLKGLGGLAGLSKNNSNALSNPGAQAGAIGKIGKIVQGFKALTGTRDELETTNLDDFAHALADTTIPAPATQTPVDTAAPAETTTKPKSTATPVQPPNPPVPSKAKVRVKAAKVPTVTLDDEI